MSNIAVLDYALGNLFNVKRAFDHLGVNTLVTHDRKEVEEADKIVLPGVGAFSEGMKHLEERGLVAVLKDSAKQGKPILGICLGMQLLMTESEEHGRWDGLDLIPGRVVRFDLPEKNKNRFKIPQIGWNKLIPSDFQKKEGKNFWKDTVLKGLDEDANMYFVHSYYVNVEGPEYSVAQSNYGRNDFCSVVQKENIIGCQFHPERSGPEGIKILKNFVSL